MRSHSGAARLLGSGDPSEYLPLRILLTKLVSGRDKANSPFSYLSKRTERNTGFGLVSERLPTHARSNNGCGCNVEKGLYCGHSPNLIVSRDAEMQRRASSATVQHQFSFKSRTALSIRKSLLMTAINRRPN